MRAVQLLQWLLRPPEVVRRKGDAKREEVGLLRRHRPFGSRNDHLSHRRRHCLRWETR